MDEVAHGSLMLMYHFHPWKGVSDDGVTKDESACTKSCSIGRLSTILLVMR
jgi:hypothetical protein